MPRPEFLVLGRVVKPHGIRGLVKAILYAESWDPFSAMDGCWLGPPGGPYRRFGLERGTGQGQAVLLKLAGVDSPETAAGLVGCEIAIPRSQAPPPPEGSFYHYDILGLEVVEDGTPLGSVQEIMETPAHDVYVIRGPRGEWLLPGTRAYIRRIDLEAGRIEVAAAAGLLAASAEGDEDAESV